MDEVTIENFRCFRGRQTARLAPLTLLVGENGTGKTSLMAMIRILWHVVFRGVHRPNFREDPFDLGSFQDIVHQSEGDGDYDREFFGGITFDGTNVETNFRQGKISVEVFRLHIANSATSATWTRSGAGGDHVKFEVTNSRGEWQFVSDEFESQELDFGTMPRSDIWGLLSLRSYLNEDKLADYNPAQPTLGDIVEWRDLALSPFVCLENRYGRNLRIDVPHAIAPVRTEPRRSYDPGPGLLDSKGAGVPEYLAALANSDAVQWKSIKSGIEEHAQRAGLFDEIRIRFTGDEAGSDPFQVQVRKRSGNDKGQWRNLVDAGYGVNQILPVILELSRSVESPVLLLQQPEVHLHPSAQAGLGPVLCDVAATKQQVLVETHSDHLIDRVRMDVRDGKWGLNPEDVSILYFERGTKDVQIHSIRIDEDGNIVDQPPSYREFFRQETNRSLGI